WGVTPTRPSGPAALASYPVTKKRGRRRASSRRAVRGGWNEDGAPGQGAFGSSPTSRAYGPDVVRHRPVWPGYGEAGFAASDGHTGEPVLRPWLDDDVDADEEPWALGDDE